MVVIFFNLGLVLAFILLVSIVFINASTKFVLAILGVICILFLIKDIIQDLYFALYKYKNNVLIEITYPNIHPNVDNPVALAVPAAK